MYEFLMKDLDGNWSLHSARELKVFDGRPGGRAAVLFNTRSLPSTGSNPAAEPTPEQQGESSGPPEIAEPTKSRPSTGETAEESMTTGPLPLPPELVEQAKMMAEAEREVFGPSAPTSPPQMLSHVPEHWVLTDGIWSPPVPSAPTSPPTTPADSPPTTSEHMTTPSAECSSPCGSRTMREWARCRLLLREARAELAVGMAALGQALGACYRCLDCSTPAPPAPASDEGKPT